MQAATKCWHEKHKEQMESYNVFTSVCHSWIPCISMVKTKLTT
jgi:hypothetical protein